MKFNDSDDNRKMHFERTYQYELDRHVLAPTALLCARPIYAPRSSQSSLLIGDSFSIPKRKRLWLHLEKTGIKTATFVKKGTVYTIFLSQKRSGEEEKTGTSRIKASDDQYKPLIYRPAIILCPKAPKGDELILSPKATKDYVKKLLRTGAVIVWKDMSRPLLIPTDDQSVPDLDDIDRLHSYVVTMFQIMRSFLSRFTSYDANPEDPDQ
ncbi:hypothetical protein FDENT_2966 [Fusarium denticulatum]|uniref:Uncharacterized protein n=1 Tax=Fusarium denticulatum TaxID=48507 RepID=A0A8H5XEG0_9HYPO|nr:hypothetical protein FDENT_2966 [Fusarium denticulatum]